MSQSGCQGAGQSPMPRLLSGFMLYVLLCMQSPRVLYGGSDHEVSAIPIFLLELAQHASHAGSIDAAPAGRGLNPPGLGLRATCVRSW